MMTKTGFITQLVETIGDASMQYKGSINIVSLLTSPEVMMQSPQVALHTKRVSAYLHTYIRTYTYTRTYCIYIYIHIYMFSRTHIHTCVHILVHMHSIVLRYKKPQTLSLLRALAFRITGNGIVWKQTKL
jgi:hypothetical protein